MKQPVRVGVGKRPPIIGMAFGSDPQWRPWFEEVVDRHQRFAKGLPLSDLLLDLVDQMRDEEHWLFDSAKVPPAGSVDPDLHTITLLVQAEADPDAAQDWLRAAAKALKKLRPEYTITLLERAAELQSAPNPSDS